ncbi:MAG: bifunctional DNA-formamidopyrimidine glycosylase/DNA-(apurinic or apyrimidinic site) lyase [Sulfuricella sp.]|nr:bifunctional DNA-formamidopyrimidine glycosylase/DNA-(apurinic or apyrimidinic site) lyase [Sulfuricella sp.]
MPELPEVEITRRGLAPHLTGQTIRAVVIRNGSLRQPIPADLPATLPGQTIHGVARRGKYLLIECDSGWLLAHLGMSGSLRVVPATTPPEKHDHFDLVLANGLAMRLRDPRRFGLILWTVDDPLAHPLLAKLGVEPLGEAFNGDVLYRASRGRNLPVKQFLMEGGTVVGVGNIYANESLFRAAIRPQTACGRLSAKRYERLAQTIKETLSDALAAGGSSLRDFTDSAGNPGYFQQQYFVYGRTGEPCRVCGAPILTLRQGQRATFYCGGCQKG